MRGKQWDFQEAISSFPSELFKERWSWDKIPSKTTKEREGVFGLIWLYFSVVRLCHIVLVNYLEILCMTWINFPLKKMKKEKLSQWKIS